MEEEVVEVATKVAFSFKPMVLVATSVVSLAAGVNIGLFVANRRLRTKYEKLAAAEIAEAKEHYARLNKTEKYATPEAAAAAILLEKGLVTDTAPIEIPVEVIDTIRTYSGGRDPRPELTEENIFDRPPVEPKSLVEMSEERFVSPVNPNGPYVITEDEFNDNEVGYTQVSITYYAGDDILTDDKDAPVEDPESIVGDALSRFGEGVSEAGQNMVFVRNTKIELDFEVTRSFGKYGIEVAGLPEIQHSSYPAPRRRSGKGR